MTTTRRTGSATKDDGNAAYRHPDPTFATPLRLACMRITRRIKLESGGGLPPHQVSVLVRLDGGPRTPGELAESERVSQPSMTRTVGCLADAGLVTRTPHPDDGRQVLIALTDSGREALDETITRREEWFAAHLERLTDAERATLAAATTILERIAAE